MHTCMYTVHAHPHMYVCVPFWLCIDVHVHVNLHVNLHVNVCLLVLISSRFESMINKFLKHLAYFNY